MRSSRIPLRLLVVFMTALGIFAVGAPAANAGKEVSRTFGDFVLTGGLDMNQASGDLYVTDSQAQQVVQYTAAGELVRMWGWGVATGAEAFEVCTSSCQAGIRGSGEGQFSFQAEDSGSLAFTGPQVAIDQADGAVYVVDSLNDRVQKFSASGAFLDEFGGGDGGFNLPQGVAVDPVSRDVYVADTGNHRVQRFDSGGGYLSQIGAAGGGLEDGNFLVPRRLAVDSTGRLFVLDRDGGRVQRFTDAGSFDQVFAAGAYSSPYELAIDRSNDHVYIAGDSADFTARGIIEFQSDGTPVDIHGARSPLSSFSSGAAIQSSTGLIYAAHFVNPASVMVLDDVGPVTASIEPVTDITASSATLNGAVNPQGPPNTNYRFEYSADDGASWSPVPGGGGAVGTGTGDVAVSDPLAGLEPNTDYQVRLVATRDFNAASATTGVLEFTTAPAPPLVNALAAGSRTDTAAWLGGDVNPRKSQTAYYIEYALATDTGYANASRLPAAPAVADAGDGSEFVTVTELATGLQPDTAYRFRVVATNEAGTTTGPDRMFTTRQTASPPPAGRGYEMVSPLDKNGADIERNLPVDRFSTSGAAPSGEVVAYVAQGQFADLPSGSPQGQYRSVRTPTGWATRGINPPVEASPVAEAVTPAVWGLSEDLSKAIVSTNSLMTPNASLLGGTWGLYLQDNSNPTNPSYQLVTVPETALPQEPPQGDGNPHPNSRFEFAGASSDYRHVVFEGRDRPLTSDAPVLGRWIFAWTNGQIDLVSVMPDGLLAASPTLGARDRGGQFYPGDHAVSDDGRRIYFSETRALYVRENGSETKTVSLSERAGEEGGLAAGVFQAADARDGSPALFTSREKLTDDAEAEGGTCVLDDGTAATCKDDLYLWDADAEEGGRLTDLTTADGGGGGVLGIAAATDDLSHVYFVAGGVLDAGGQSGRPNVYLWTPGGGVRYVTTLVDADIAVWSTERDSRLRQFRDARVSADGGHLLFTSYGRVTAADNSGHLQVYLYDLAEDRTVCVSCPDSGGPAGEDAWLFYPTDLGPNPSIDAPRAPLRLPRNLSDDGKRVFFETDQALLAADSNGKADVYMWESGELSLVSSGRSGERSEFIDASASGNDVFFTTRERLVGFDIDDQVDVYDARVGGGFPDQRPPPECVGDGCQGEFSSPPAGARPVSGALTGRGDLTRRLGASLSLRAMSASQRARLAAGKRVVLRIRINRAGVVRVTARARVAGRPRIVARGFARAGAAGVVLVGLRLSRPALRQLAAGDRLMVSLAARFSGARQPRTLRLDLRRAGR